MNDRTAGLNPWWYLDRKTLVLSITITSAVAVVAAVITVATLLIGALL